MALPDATIQRYRQQQRVSALALAEARRLWRRMGREFDASWRQIAPQLVVLLTGMQQVSARQALAAVQPTLDELGLRAPAVGRVNVAPLAGVASDGRPLDELLYEPVIKAKAAVGAGATVDQALATGGSWLEMAVLTQVADAGRVAESLGIVARPRIGGYARMLNPPSCSRCAVLAGAWYKWNAGFQRHPRCDCVHIPANEDMLGDLRTDPRDYFNSLDEAEQARVFTKAGAQAIRDGADIGQVVNARTGAAGLTPAGKRLTAEEARALRGGRDRGHLATRNVYGQQVYTTTEGTTRRGIAGQRLQHEAGTYKVSGERYSRARTPRLMPESIYQIAESREDAIRLLRRYGYII